MAALFQVFWQIALLRKGPQVLPASRELLWALLVTGGLIDIMLFVIRGLSLDRATLLSLLDILIMVAVVHILLVVHRYQGRVTQTLSAMAGCGVLLGLLALPLLVMFNLGGEMQAFAAVFWLLLLGWNVAVIAHIFRNALDVTLGMGLLFAISYILISMFLTSFIVPAEAPV